MSLYLHYWLEYCQLMVPGWDIISSNSTILYITVYVCVCCRNVSIMTPPSSGTVLADITKVLQSQDKSLEIIRYGSYETVSPLLTVNTKDTVEQKSKKKLNYQ